MKQYAPFLLSVVLLFAALSSCAAPATPDLSGQINQIVAATLMAIPKDPPAPTYTPYPTPTPLGLVGLFCEYQFCVGHPREVAFWDLSAQKNPLAGSAYESGALAAVSGSLYLQLIWQRAPGTSDPKFLLDLILLPQADIPTGNLDVKLLRGMNVLYTALDSSATPLTYGGAGAWTCGERVFAWKAYTPQADSPALLFNEALEKFTCGE